MLNVRGFFFTSFSTLASLLTLSSSCRMVSTFQIDPATDPKTDSAISEALPGVVPAEISLDQSTLTIEPATMRSGETAILSLVLKDDSGNPVLDPNQTQNLSLSVLALGVSSGTLGNISFVAESPGTYRASLTGIVAGTTNSIQATLKDRGVFARTTSFTVLPSDVSPTLSTVIASTASVLADGVEFSTLTVTLKDANSNRVPGKTVTLTSSRGAADTISFISNVSDSTGVVSFTVKSQTNGTSIYSARDSTDDLAIVATTTVVFAAGAAAKLAFATQPSISGVAGVNFSSQPVVSIQDAQGNPVGSSATVVLTPYTDIACTVAGTGTLNGSSVAAALGSASFLNLNYTKSGTLYLKASSGTLTTACSNLVTVTNAAADHLVLMAGDVQNATVATAVGTAPQVRVVDFFGNPVSGVSLTFTVTSGGGSVGASPVTSNASGLASSSYTLGTASGSNTMVVARETTALPGTPATLTFTETGIGGPPTRIVFSTQPPTNGAACGSLSTQPVVTLLDTYDNVSTPASNAVTLAAFSDSSCITAGAGTLSAVSNPKTSSSGVAAFTGVSYTLPGNLYIKASVSGLTPICSNLSTLTEGPASKVVFTTQPSSPVVAGVLLGTQPAVSVQDACGNALPSATNSITLAAYSNSACTTAGTGTFSVTTNPLSAVGGTSTFSGVSYTKSGNLYIRATSTGLTQACSSLVSVTPSPPTKLVLTGPAGVWAGSCSTAYTATSQDQYSNVSNVTSATTVDLSGGGSGIFYSDSSCTTSVSSLVMNSGTSAKSFYFKDVTVESLTLSAADASTVLTTGTLATKMQSKLVLSGTTPVTTGACTAYTVTNKNFLGTPLDVSANTTVTIATSGASSALYSDSACTTTTSSVTLLAGTSSTGYYMKATLVGAASLTATNTNPMIQNSAALAVTVSPSPPSRLVLTGSTFHTTGACSPAFSVNTQDPFKNISNVTSLTTVNLSDTGSGVFYSDSTCSSPVTSVTISSGTSSAAFYFLDSAAESTTLTALDDALVLTSSSFLAEVSNPATAVRISTGLNYTCTEAGGAAKCWGINTYGNLGDGTTTSRSLPTQVSGLTSGVQTIQVGEYHTCAVVSGAAKCWGYNGYGGVGDGTTVNRTVPTQVSGLISGVQAIAVNHYHSCALLTGGSVKCWGYNGYGQVGDGTTTYRTVPTQVSGLTSGVAAIITGYQHSCALLTDGSMKCWGYNGYGQIGDGTTTNRTVPTQVSGLTSGGQVTVSGAHHNCVMLTDGAVKCWGYNGYGGLGDGTFTTRKVPIQVSGLIAGSGVLALTAGWYHSCALLTGGSMKCWGYNGLGQIGDNTLTNRTTPVTVQGLSAAVQSIAAGHHVTCGTVSGGALCWGFNTNNQLGNDSVTNRSLPVSGVSLK